MAESVLVLCATGKAGTGVCRALVDEGFEVYGTTRSASGAAKLTAIGVKPITANYTVGADVARAISESGAKKVFGLNDLIGAAKGNVAKCHQAARDMIDACKAADLDHFILMAVISIDEIDVIDKKSKHIHSNAWAADYLVESGMKSYSIVQPAVFMENFADAGNGNPLKKGALKMLTNAPCKWVACYDIGKACAVHFKAPATWHGKRTNCATLLGTMDDACAALAAVSGVKVTGSLMLPNCLRGLFIPDLHAMCRQVRVGVLSVRHRVTSFRRRRVVRPSSGELEPRIYVLARGSLQRTARATRAFAARPCARPCTHSALVRSSATVPFLLFSSSPDSFPSATWMSSRRSSVGAWTSRPSSATTRRRTPTARRSSRRKSVRRCR